MVSKTQDRTFTAERVSVTSRSRLHFNDWNVLQRFVLQHSMADLHDKEGNDNLTKKNQ